MKKRVLSLFLCFVLCLSLCPTAAFADGEEGHTHEPQEETPLVVSATMAPEPTEAPAEPTAEPAPEPVAEPEPTAEATPEPTVEPTAAPETETTPEPTAEPTPEPVVEPTAAPETENAEAMPAAALEGATSGPIRVDYYDRSSSAWKTTYDSSMSSVYDFLVTNNNAPRKTSEWGDDPAAYRAVITLQQDVTVSSDCRLGRATTYYYAGMWHSSSFTGDYTYIKLDLNGHKITVSNGATLTLQGDMIVCDSSETKTGSIEGSVAVKPSDTNLQLQNGNLEKVTCEYEGSVTVGSGVTVNTFVGEGGSVTVNTGATVGAINAQGNSTTVSGGTVTSITGYGNVTVSAGTVTTLNVSVNGSNSSNVVVTGGSIGTFSYAGTNSYDVSLQGGTFDMIAQTGKPLSCVSLLSNSSYYGYYAFFDKSSGQIVSAATQTLTNVEVKAHTTCDFAALHNGYCACGRACEHGGWGTDSAKTQCETCSQLYVARVEVSVLRYVPEEDSYVTTQYCYATSLADAMAATSKYSGSVRLECQYTITLLQDVTAETSLAMTGRTRCVTLDLDGHSITGDLSYDGEKGADNYDSGNSLFTVKNSKNTGEITNLSVKNGEVTIDSTARITTLNVLANTKEFSNPDVNPNDFMFVTVSGNVTNLNANGGALKVTGGTVATLTVADGASVQLTGGSFTKILQPAGANAKPVSALLESQHVFKKKNVSTVTSNDVIANNTAISSLPNDLSGYEIVSCDHWGQTADSCTYCAQEFNVATVTQGDWSQNYGSVKEAFEAAKVKSASGAVTVKLLDNASVSETISLDSGTITLELNGKSLSSEYTILALSGTAVLMVDATQGGSINSAHGESSRAPYTAPITVSGTNARLTLKAVSVTNDTAGDIELSGGTTTVEGDSNFTVPVSISGGTLNIQDGTLNKGGKDGNENALSISGTNTVVNVSGGTVNDTLGITGGTLNVSNGTVNQINATGGTTNVSGGTVTTLNVSTGSKVNLTGGTYATITIPEGKTYLDLLPLTGVAFQRGGSIVDASGTALPGSGAITVVTHNCEGQGRCECGRGYVAMIGEQGYNTFAEALEAAQNGDTIKLLADVTAPADGENSKIDLNGKTVTVDLNGHNLTGTGNLTIIGNVTITDGDSSTASGQVETGDDKYVLVAGASDSLTIAGGHVLRAKAEAGTVEVTGGRVDTLMLPSASTADVKVTGGKIETLNLHGTGQHIISGGEITGTATISAVGAGTTTISGGTFNALALNGVSPTSVMLQGGKYKTIRDEQYQNNGSFMDRVTPASGQTAGSAMYAYRDGSETGAYLSAPSGDSKTLQATTGDQYIHVVPHNCTTIADTGVCECGRQYVAKIDTTLYYTLEAALTAATADNTTIKLLANAAAPRFKNGNNSQIDRNGKGAVTIDLNGKKLNCAGRLYIYGDVTIKDDSTAKSGTVIVGSGESVYVGESSRTGNLTIAGGKFSDVTLQKGTLNVSGGTITDALRFSSGTNSDDKLTISGGTIATAYFTESSEKTVSGGSIGTLRLEVNCTAENTKLSGGTVTTELNLYGGKADFGADFKFKKITADSGKLVDRLPAGKAFYIGETVSSADTDTIEAGENQYITLKGHDCNELDANGKCACGRGYEACIDDTLYVTLEAALTAAEANGTITLLANVTAPTDGDTNSKIAPSVPVTIDLNGKTLSGAGDLTLSGDVTITDGAERGKLRAGDGKSVISTDTLTITDGDVSPLTVTDGTVKIEKNAAISQLYIHGGAVAVTGGTINQIDYLAKVDGSDNQGTIKMSGGQFQTITKRSDMPAGGYLALLEPGYAFYRNGELQNAKSAGQFNSDTDDLYSVDLHNCTESTITNGMCACGRSYEACIGDTLYATFEAALAAAANDGSTTITLLADHSAQVFNSAGESEGLEEGNPGNYSIFEPKKNVTIDLNGYQINGTGDLYLIGPMTITNTKNTGAVSTTAEKSVIIGGEVTLAGGASITNAVAVAGAGDYPSSLAAAEYTDYAAGELLVKGGSVGTLELDEGGTVRMTGGSVTTLDVTGNGELTVTGGTVGTLNVTNANASVTLSGGRFEKITANRYLQKLLAPNHAFSTSTSTANITNAAWDKKSWTATTETPYLYVVEHASHTPSSTVSDAVTTRCACGQPLSFKMEADGETTYFTDFTPETLNHVPADATLTMLSNSSFGGSFTMTKSFTLDLNGHSIHDGGSHSSFTVGTGCTLTLKQAGGEYSNFVPNLIVGGNLVLEGAVSALSVSLDSTGQTLKTNKNDAGTAPLISNLSVTGRVNGRATLCEGTEIYTIHLGTGMGDTLLDLLGEKQAFEEHWTDGDTEQSVLYNADVPGYSAENRWLKVVAHESCTYDKTAATGHCACGRACPHSAGFDDETGACGTCGAQMAARIGDKYYASFADAVKAARSCNTITLLADVTGTGAVTFPAGSYTIDLNGKALGEESNTYNITLLPKANLTIKANSEDSSKSARKVRIALPMVAAPITVQGKTESGSTTVGKLTLNGVDAADVTLLNQEGGALNAEEMLTLQGGASVTTLRVHGGGVALGGALKTALAETDIVLGDGTTGGYLDIASDVTVKNVTVNSASTLDITGGTAAAVDVKSGGIIKMTGGNVTTMTIAPIPGDGTATLANFTITGGNIETLALGDTGVATYASIHRGLSGGSYGKIEIKGGISPAVRELLAPGYAFKKGGAFVLWGGAQGASIENVNVAKCVHQNNTLGAECLYCGKTLVAQLDADGKVSFYTSFADALAAAPTTGESVITLLKDCGDGSATHQVNKTLRLILGGHKLKDTLEITAGGCLTVANSSGSTLAAIEQTGGTLKVESDAQAVIKELTVSGGTTKLSGGTYNSITTSNGITAGSLLAANSAYYQTAEGSGKTWLTVTNETALQNVSVGLIPLHGMELSASPENPTYGTELTLTARLVYDATYEWYEVVNGTENTITTPETDPYKLELRPNAGSHTYRCKVTKDGYTVTLEKTVTVAKANIGDDFITPKANTGLIYNGGAQALIQAGSFNPGFTGCTIQYKLGADGTYGTDASALKAKDAGTYTVYYYVDGGTNYNSIGSADSPREIKVTIAPLDIGGNSARLYYVTPNYTIPYYNGQPQAPAITLTLVHRNNTSPTETTIIEIAALVKDVDYTQSVTQHTNAGFYPASFTGMGNYTGTKTVDWNIERLNASDATGSLTVYNRIAHTYTVDLASLLPELPSGYEYGKLAYALNAVGDGDDDSKITVEGYLGEYSLTNGTLTLPVNAVDSTDTDTIATLRVTVMPENYFPFTLTLNVSRANRVSPIDVGAPLEGLTKDNVTSDDREDIEDLLDDLEGYLAQNPGEGETKELENLKKEAEELIERLDDAKAAMEDDAIGAADDIDASNAKPSHKGKLRSAKKAIQDALDTYGPNYTEAEKAALNEKLTRINAALAAIEKLEQAEENARNDRTDKPVKTGDEATPILWIVLIVAAAGCVVVLLAARKKKK